MVAFEDAVHRWPMRGRCGTKFRAHLCKYALGKRGDSDWLNAAILNTDSRYLSFPARSDVGHERCADFGYAETVSATVAILVLIGGKRHEWCSWPERGPAMLD